MLVLAILVVILSIFGLPWYVAATVTALAHIMSLRKESECTAPGEKPMFLGIRFVEHFSRGVRFPTIWHLTSVDSDEPLQSSF